ncbi:hypothetical protein E2R59_06260 [Kocuria rosea]|uniref:EVE domain-containing protein n=1 Tax=Kocuria rosea TaxID=1275 RepID=A0A4R5YIG2_KOCRO|nr:hypothetical protein E2R59_06260 [Kocuria rosea]
MKSYLLVIGDREALGWILTTSRMAFPSGKRSEVTALEADDELFLYTTRNAFRNPTQHRGRIIGTARVAGPVTQLDEPISFAGRQFPVGCPLKIGSLAPFGAGIELRPLVDSIAALKGADASWPTRLRRPLVTLSDSEADLIHQTLAPALSADVDINEYTRWYLKSRTN